LLLAGMATATFVVSATSDNADRVAISELWKIYSESAMKRDAAAWLAVHEENAFKMPQGRPMFTIAQIAPILQEQWDRDAKSGTLYMGIDCHETSIHGDVAWCMGTYVKKLRPAYGGAPSTFDGKFLTVLRKQADGSWKICRDCYNSNVPSGM